MLPIAAAVLMNVQLKIGTSDMAVTAAHMFYAFRVVSVISVLLVGQLPSGGLNLYVLSGIAAMLVQTHICDKTPSVRSRASHFCEEHGYEACDNPGFD
ncbi:hypothetical protein EI94DRAFT_1816757 [Lactarius quietus]|nr:hypothetical protein EI94DRAFT_1816757 [Lactarius quietus]